MSITEFCFAYMKGNHYNLSKYIPKAQRQVILQWLDQTSNNLSQFCQPTTNLQYLVIELFSQRPAEIPYVTVLLEYAILDYTNIENLSIDDYIQYISTLLQDHSNFTPKKRYNGFICKILFFLQVL